MADLSYDPSRRVTALAARAQHGPAASFGAAGLFERLASRRSHAIERVHFHDNTCIIDPRGMEFWRMEEDGRIRAHAVEWLFDDGAILGVTADRAGNLAGYNHSVLESDDYLIDHLDIGSVWDVSDLWWTFLGTPIVAVTILPGRQDTVHVSFANGAGVSLASDAGWDHFQGKALLVTFGARTVAS